MTVPELFDTGRVADDQEHWNGLAERIAATAAYASKPSSIDWLATSRASWVAASLLLVGGAWALLTPTESSSPKTFINEWEQALAPTDDVGEAMIVRDSPPAIGALLLGDRRRDPR
jgi:hypothetical protein